MKWKRRHLLVIKRLVILSSTSAIFIFILIRSPSPSIISTTDWTSTYSNTSSIELSGCGCMRELPSINSSAQVPYNTTTCGKEAWSRGGGQKVVGYSFYGDPHSDHHKEKQYFRGIEANLVLLPSLYPGWVVRLYHDAPPGSPLLSSLCSVACSSDLLDLCYVRNLPGVPTKNAEKIFAMNWRFFPTLDPQVDVYVSRDLDSTMTTREAKAVEEWMDSGKGIHSMRDHPWHGVEMVGASWGARLNNNKFRAMWKQSWKHILKDSITYAGRDKTGPDQAILTRYVWPWGKKESMQHDSYTCRRFPGSIGFPTRRENITNNFIASWGANKPLWEVCPVKCRRNKEWDHC